jgi:hypothetical protein
MSTTMVRLAGDMASFNNASPEDTLLALQAGLVGQVRPLRQFGVNLSDTGLRAEAARLQLGKIGPTLTTQQKAIAAYSLILQQSKTAQGDFARTSGGLANQQRIMAAEFKDSSAALGQDFLPIALDLVSFARKDIIPTVTKMADVFAGLPKPVREVGLVSLVAAGPLIFLTGKVLSGVATLSKAKTAWTAYKVAKLAQIPADATVATAEGALAAETTAAGVAAAGATTKFALLRGAGGLGLIGLAAVTVGFAFVKLKDSLQETAKKNEEYGRTAVVGGKGGQLFAERVDQLGTAHSKAAGATKDATQKTAEYTQAISDQYPQLDIATAKQIATNAASKDQAIQAAKGAQAIKDYTKALEDYNNQLEQTKTTVSGAIPVFEGFHTTGVKSSAKLRDAIIKDLRQEVGGLTTWAADTQTLLHRGADPAFILELSKKGPEYVHAMATGSDTQLKLAQKFFQQRMDAIRKLSTQQLGLAGVEAPQAFASGLNASKPKVSAASRAIAAAATNPLKLQNVARTLGRDTGAGLAEGVNSKAVRQKVKVNSAAVALYLSTTMSDTLGIHSPSTVAFRIGEQYMEGLIGGMVSKAGKLSGTAVSLAGLMSKGLSPAEAWIIQHESGGSVLADNPTSTAFGLGQLLLGNRQRIGGILGFSPNTTSWAEQLAMFRYYYRERYGTAENAKAFWQAHGWYGKGMAPTVFDRPTLIGVGERGPETVSVTPQARALPAGDVAAALDRLADALARQPIIIQVDSREIARANRVGSTSAARLR